MDVIHKVFVSSTYEDLREERAAVQKTLIEMKCFPIGMEIFPASSEPAWEFIKRQIDDSDYYVLIVAARYGSTHRETGLSYTEMEYDYASSKDVPIFAFLHGDPGKIHDKFRDPDEVRRNKLAAFRTKIQENKLCKTWTTLDELDARVAKSIVAAKDHFKREGFVRASLAVDHKKMSDLLLENQTLKEKLDALENKRSKSDFAHGKDTTAVYFHLSRAESVAKLFEALPPFSYIGSTYDGFTCSLGCTWDDILLATGRALMTGCTERIFRNQIVDMFKFFLENCEKLSRENLEKILSAKIRLTEESFSEIELQFRALSFIGSRRIERDDQMSGTRIFERELSLTAEGIEALAQLRARRRLD